jgi:CDP-diglyceride synthetase
VSRVLSGVALAGAFFAVVWFANATVLLFVALAVAALAFHEYAELMRQLGAAIPRLPALIATLAVVVMVPFPHVRLEATLGLGVVLLAIASMARLSGRGVPAAAAAPPSGAQAVPVEGRTTDGGLGAGGATARGAAVLGVVAGGFASVYIGVTLGTLVALHVVGGRGAVVLLVATVAISDTAQYYSGRLLGRRPLAPLLSPKKTLEGALGGFVAAPLFLYFAGPYLVPPAAPTTLAVLGLALVVCGIAGDLFESMIKRAADIKDSSALIPGHGGVLDRIDALLFAAPAFYVYLRWVYTP